MFTFIKYIEKSKNTMNKFGIQYLGEDIKTPIKHSLNKQTELEQYSEIRKILKKGNKNVR